MSENEPAKNGTENGQHSQKEAPSRNAVASVLLGTPQLNPPSRSTQQPPSVDRKGRKTTALPASTRPKAARAFALDDDDGDTLASAKVERRVPSPTAEPLPFSREQLRIIRDRKVPPVPGVSGLVPEYHQLHSAFELLDLSVCMAIQPEQRRWTTLSTEVRRASLGAIECTLGMLGKLLGTWVAECQAGVLYLLEWATYHDAPRRDFTLALPDHLTRTERVLARVRRSTLMKEGLVRRQEKFRAGLVPSWELPRVEVADPAAVNLQPSATLASLLRRPDLTPAQREQLTKATTRPTSAPLGSAGDSGAGVKGASGTEEGRAAVPVAANQPNRPGIPAHLLARVRERELMEAIRRKNPTAEITKANQEQCLKVMTSMHAVMLHRMDAQSPAITMSRAELVERLQKGSGGGLLQMRLSETVIDHQLKVIVAACQAMGNDWFVSAPTQQLFTFRRTFQITAVMDHIRPGPSGVEERK